MNWPRAMNSQVSGLIRHLEGVDRGMGGVPSAGPRAARLLGGLVLATHAGPTVAVTTVATLLAVAAGVAPGRTVLLAVAVLAGRPPSAGATTGSMPTGTGPWRGPTSRSCRAPSPPPRCAR